VIDGEVTVRAGQVLIATGGFKNSPEMRAEFLPGAGIKLVTRSNPASDGHGIRLGRGAGAALSEHMTGWYGHTIPYPVKTPLEPQDYIPLAQFFLSPRAVLLDRDGHRFTDESRGYYLNAQAVALLPGGRALIVFDDALRIEDSGKNGVDRWAFARRKGANVAQATTLEELTRAVALCGAIAAFLSRSRVTMARSRRVPHLTRRAAQIAARLGRPPSLQSRSSLRSLSRMADCAPMRCQACSTRQVGQSRGYSLRVPMQADLITRPMPVGLR